MLRALGLGVARSSSRSSPAGSRSGALTLVRADPGRPFDRGRPSRSPRSSAARAGTAVLNARTYTERAAIAATLQRGLRPPRAARAARLRGRHALRRRRCVNEVGGDFYDAFATPDGWMLVIGDVAGHGAEAAALTALARYTLRSAGQLTRDPRAPRSSSTRRCATCHSCRCAPPSARMCCTRARAARRP